MKSLTNLGTLVKEFFWKGMISKPIEAHVQEPLDFYTLQTVCNKEGGNR